MTGAGVVAWYAYYGLAVEGGRHNGVPGFSGLPAGPPQTSFIKALVSLRQHEQTEVLEWMMRQFVLADPARI
jgi:hypothetical protein